MRSLLTPIALMLALTAFSVWHASSVEAEVARWTAQLTEIDALAAAGDWAEAAEKLAVSYDDWHRRHGYLTMTIHHDMVADAEAMYLRAVSFALEEDTKEFRAELAGLRSHLRFLAEAESFRPENVL